MSENFIFQIAILVLYYGQEIAWDNFIHCSSYLHAVAVADVVCLVLCALMVPVPSEVAVARIYGLELQATELVCDRLKRC